MKIFTKIVVRAFSSNCNYINIFIYENATVSYTHTKVSAGYCTNDAIMIMRD